jgi:hypothetical protein
MFGNNYEPVSNSSGTSGWGYMNNIVGGLDQQYNSLMGSGSGNTLNIRSPSMAGGRKYSRHHRRGGSFIPVIANAVVPLGLLAVQQTYGKRTNSKRTRRKY